MQDLLKTRDKLREGLDERVTDEFERYETMGNERINKEEDETILRDVCFIIEALGDTPRLLLLFSSLFLSGPNLLSRTKFVSWFVKGQLFDYKQAFRMDQSASQLDSIERRYAWLKREFIYLDETYLYLLHLSSPSFLVILNSSL